MVTRMCTAFLILIWPFAMTCSQTLNGQNTSSVLDSVAVRFVSFDLETPIRIESKTFENYFGKRVIPFSVTDRPSLDSLAILVRDLKPSKAGFMPDVRLVAEMYYSDSTKKVLCMSDIAVEIDNTAMEFESKLFSFLEEKAGPYLNDYQKEGDNQSK